MSVGLLTLLDDIAAIAKIAAASVDDIAAQAVNTGAKAAGVVIDDAAVTPKYVVGLSPARELPIIWNIAKGSIKNKLLFLLPATVGLGWLAPWAIAPILCVGGLFLCFEGFEKLHHLVQHSLHPEAVEQHGADASDVATPEALEQERTKGAIRTDFILSAEIMAISYATVIEKNVATQLIILALVAISITVAVYGFVALVVKADDMGLHLANGHYPKWMQRGGRALVKAMPHLLKIIGMIGMAAMLWVGGGIVIHTFPPLHHAMAGMVENLHMNAAASWLTEAALLGVVGIACGWMVDMVVRGTKKLLYTARETKS
jgi:uncharacterized protein